MYALHTLSAPGTLAAGYHRGDEISDSVVESWGLAVGVDVSAERPDPSTVPAPVMARPGPEANRTAWESYAMANGMPAGDAAAASQDELESIEPAEGTPERPADSAKKAEWVKYVSGLAPDDETRTWATDESTTKADLQNWETPTVDTVALSATEQTQG